MTGLALAPAPAVSKLGQVAVIRGDDAAIIKLLNLPTTEPANEAATGGTMPSTTHTIDLDQPLTLSEVHELYGISSGPIHRESASGTIRTRGKRGRCWLYDHRDVLRAFDDGHVKLPRAGGPKGIPEQQRDEARSRIAEGIAKLHAERQQVRAYTNADVAELSGAHASSVPGLMEKRGVRPLHVPQRRGEPWRWPADEVDAALAEHPVAQRRKPAKPQPHPEHEPEAATSEYMPAQAGPTPPLVSEAKASTHGRIAVAELQLRAGAELAVLRGMVAMLPVEQREVLSPQLARVQAALVTDDEG